MRMQVQMCEQEAEQEEEASPTQRGRLATVTAALALCSRMSGFWLLAPASHLLGQVPSMFELFLRTF